MPTITYGREQKRIGQHGTEKGHVTRRIIPVKVEGAQGFELVCYGATGDWILRRPAPINPLRPEDIPPALAKRDGLRAIKKVIETMYDEVLTFEAKVKAWRAVQEEEARLVKLLAPVLVRVGHESGSIRLWQHQDVYCWTLKVANEPPRFQGYIATTDPRVLRLERADARELNAPGGVTFDEALALDDGTRWRVLGWDAFNLAAAPFIEPDKATAATNTLADDLIRRMESPQE